MENKRPIRRLVVKFGTTNLCDKSSGLLSDDIIRGFVRQIVEARDSGIEVLVVSSGAIKAGREALKNVAGIKKRHFGKKELAGIGSRHLLDMWGRAFSYFYSEVAQVWVTYGNWESVGERKSIKSSILNCAKKKIIPVINENDVVSSEEIELMDSRISENDRLARMVAFLTNADAVLFLTEEGGIYNGDPKINSDAKMYEEISVFARPEEIGISNGVSEGGTGGMAAKLKEASLCAKKGMRVAIAGNEREVIIRFVKGESVGTKIGAENRLKEK